MIRLKVFFAARQSPTAAIRRLLATQKSLQIVKRGVWVQVNEYLRDVVTRRFLDQIAVRYNTPSTIEWKRKRAAGTVPEKRGAGGDIAFAKGQFVATYGKMTGFFLEKLNRVQVGTSTFVTSELGVNALNWGINLPDFFRGYPGYILNGVLMSTTGGPGLMSINRGDLEIVRNIIFYQYFLPAIAMGRRRVAAGAA